MIRLFEVEDKIVKVTEHCHMIKWLRAIMEKYPDPAQHLKIYAYIFYMSCPGQDNPYHNVKQVTREESISQDIELDFDTEDDIIIEAIKKATELYETPTARAHRAMSTMLDNISDYMLTAKPSAGRDGNLPALIKLATDFDDIRKSHKNVTKDLEEEQTNRARGGQDLAYDQQ